MNLLRFIMKIFKTILLRLQRLFIIVLLRLLLALNFVCDPLIRFFFFRKISSDYRQKNIFFTGAAPTAKEPIDGYDKFIAVGSGGDLLENKFKKTCDLLVMDRSFFNLDHQVSCKSKSAMLKEKAYPEAIENLIVVASNTLKADIEYGELIKSTHAISVSVLMRAYIVNSVCGSKFLDNISLSGFTQVGTGSWTIAFMVFLGVKSIHVTGMNLRTGTKSDEYTRYYYHDTQGEKEIDYYCSSCRNHSAPDVFVLSAISLRKTAKITTDEEELECVVSLNKS